jgi:chromosome segregation ATPase
MDRAQRASHLRYIEELDERDVMLAAALDELARLTEDVHSLRLRAAVAASALERLPSELVGAADDVSSAVRALDEAVAALTDARANTTRLEAARRPNRDDLDQARRELNRAEEEAHDATARLDRARARVVALGDEQSAAQTESEGLLGAARSLATRISVAPRVADAGKTEPGASVSELDEWGARARAALFVAHSAFASERERVLLEANALGVAVLGDEVGQVSVASVRRRLEQTA